MMRQNGCTEAFIDAKIAELQKEDVIRGIINQEENAMRQRHAYIMARSETGLFLESWLPDQFKLDFILKRRDDALAKLV